MIFDELNTAFRWYKYSITKQNRYKGACQALCNFGLATPCNDLLPFQIRTNNFGTPTTWELIYLDGDITIPAISASATYDASAWSAGGASFNCTITLSFVLGGSNTKTIIGCTSTDGFFASLVSFYNGLGYGDICSYNSSTNSFVMDYYSSGTIGNGEFIVGFSATGAGSPSGIAGSATFSGGADESTSDTLDISNCIANINKYTDPNSIVYLTYNGGSLSGCLPKQLDCGKWYSKLQDEENNIFYSEVFEVVLIEGVEDTFPSLDPSLFTALRFYDDIEKQTRYKSNCESACEFYLKCDKAKIPGFMFRADSISAIQSFKLIGVDDGCENLLEISTLETASYLGYDYVYYNGNDIEDLPCGKFYIQICDITQCWYSELFELIDMSNISTIEYLTTDGGDILMSDDGIGLTVD